MQCPMMALLAAILDSLLCMPYILAAATAPLPLLMVLPPKVSPVLLPALPLLLLLPLPQVTRLELLDVAANPPNPDLLQVRAEV